MLRIAILCVVVGVLAGVSPVIVNAEADAYEPDNTVEDATLISTDGTSQNHTIDPIGDVDYLKFEATEGVRYLIETHVWSGGDTWTFLYDTDGTTLIDSDDDSGIGWGDRLSFTPVASGIYYIRLCQHWRAANDTGPYRIEVRPSTDGSISGVVKDEAGNPIEGAYVRAYEKDHPDYHGSEHTAADGSYTIVDLPPGSYKVDASSSGYVQEYYDNVYSSSSATPVAVTELNDTPNTDFTLGPGGSISGVVKDEAGNPIEGASVYASGDSWGYASTAADGSYTMAYLAPGSYQVRASFSGYVEEYYDNVYSSSSATPVAVTEPNDTPNIDFTLGPGGSISGVVKDEAGNPIEGAYVRIVGLSSSSDHTEADGSYTIAHLAPGTYQVRASAPYYVEEYYDNVYSSSSATPVAVTEPNDTPNIDFALEAVPDTTPPAIPVVTDDGETTASTSRLHATWTSSDAESGIAEYQYAIGSTPGGTDVVDWTSAGKDDQVTRGGLNLAAGETFYFAVKARNAAGLWSGAGVSDGIQVVPASDTTQPTTPVVTDDGATTTSTTQLHATWSASDAESGIAEYQYAIGTSFGGTDLVGWTSAGTDTEVTHTGLSLSVGSTYYFSVKAKNGADMWSAIRVSDGIEVVAPPDTTPPTAPVVTDDGDTTIATTQLHATWAATDAESGIAEYQYATGTTSGGTDVVGWTSVGTSSEVTKTGLSLSVGSTYYFSVKAENGAGLWSAVGVSDGISVVSPGTITPPSASTSSATSVKTNSAKLNGSLSSLGTAATVNVSFEYSTVSGSYANETTTQAKTSIGAYYFDLSGLDPGTTYYYRSKAVGDGTTYGPEISFTTVADGPPPDDQNGDDTNGEVGGCCSSSNVRASAADIAMVWGALGLCCGTGLLVAKKVGKRSKK